MLTSESGTSRPPSQLMAEGDSFHDAFEEVLGISVAYFQESLYLLMEAYLE
jgi:hypothetical protein